MIRAPDTQRYFKLKTVELVVFDTLAQSVYWDMEVMLGIIQEMPEQSQLRMDSLYIANKMINVIHAGRPE